MNARTLAVSLALVGCGGGGGDGTPDAATSPDMLQGSSCQPATVSCTDESIQDLALYKTVSPANRTVTNTADGAGFATEIDARGGGYAPTESYVYAKFTPTGLTKVEIGDEDALASQDWDIAFRRFVIRLNSGVSGPSCVQGALTAGTDYDALTSVSTAQTFAPETYYSSTCTLVKDEQGDGAPGTLLSSYWSYTSCVQMTNDVFVIQTADGKVEKLTVTHYYEQSVQDACNTSGTMTSAQETAAAQIGVRWSYL